jgi:hypothetical protein
LLFSSGASITVPLMGLALHQHALCRLSFAWLGFQAELSVLKGQLLIELVPCLREFVEPRVPLVVGAVVVRCWLRFRAARCGGHADVALPCGVVTSRGPCPQSRRRPRGCAGHAEAANVGCHRVIWEAGLSTGVYRSVPLHELPPSPAVRLHWPGRQGW